MIWFKLVHVLAVLVWVGGMFFAHVALRPAAVEVLPPPQRLALWDKVFRRFFSWVWLSVGLILLTGFYIIYQYGGMAYAPPYVHTMLLLGLLMSVIYAYIFFGCYVPFSLHVAKQHWTEAGTVLGRIRGLVTVNLVLGIVTVVVAVVGPAWR